MKKERKCHWFWGHNFNKWVKTQEYIKYSWSREVGNGIVQQRQCKDCNYIELKNEEIETH